ncbi:MAG TPA: hypothetical protein DDZ51_29265 [Planctomycetaceae bacterium]|nr:hypothetical protein [Planctomycetaceae bacterium]
MGVIQAPLNGVVSLEGVFRNRVDKKVGAGHCFLLRLHHRAENAMLGCRIKSRYRRCYRKFGE